MGASETNLDANETASAAARLAVRAEELDEALRPQIEQIRSINAAEPWKHDQYGRAFRESYLGTGSDGESAVDSILGSCEGICGATFQLGETAGLGAITSELVDEESGAQFDQMVGELDGTLDQLGAAGQEQRAAAAEFQAGLAAGGQAVAAGGQAVAAGGEASWAAAPAPNRLRRAAGAGTDADRAGAAFRALRRGEPGYGFRRVPHQADLPVRRLANRMLRPDEAAATRHWSAAELAGNRTIGSAETSSETAHWVARQVPHGDVSPAGTGPSESGDAHWVARQVPPGDPPPAGSVPMDGPGTGSVSGSELVRPGGYEHPGPDPGHSGGVADAVAADRPAGAQPAPADRDQPGQDEDLGRIAESASHPQAAADEPGVPGEAVPPGGLPAGAPRPHGRPGPAESPETIVKYKTPARTGESTVAG